MAEKKTRTTPKTVDKPRDEPRVAEEGRTEKFSRRTVGDSAPTQVRDPRPAPGETPKGSEGGSKTSGSDN